MPTTLRGHSYRFSEPRSDFLPHFQASGFNHSSKIFRWAKNAEDRSGRALEAFGIMQSVPSPAHIQVRSSPNSNSWRYYFPVRIDHPHVRLLITLRRSKNWALEFVSHQFESNLIERCMAVVAVKACFGRICKLILMNLFKRGLFKFELKIFIKLN